MGLLLLGLCLLPVPVLGADRTFLAFGDSITRGHGDTGVICPTTQASGGYPPRLEQRLRARGLDAEVLSFGVCGEETAAGLSRIDSVLAVGGDVILIMEGTNDISGGVGVETMRFNIEQMARKARGVGVEPVYASVIPRRFDAPGDGDNVVTRALAEALRDDAAREGFQFADPFHALIDLPSLFSTYYNDRLHTNGAGYGLIADAFVEPALAAEACPLGPGACTESTTVLCLNQGRFQVEAEWEDFEGVTGVGVAVPQTDDSGAFYFFNAANIELIVKVLDGRSFNDHFWVFYGALSDTKFSIRVKDTETGRCREYFNPLGSFASIGDTTAFFSSPP